jgi:hypothetical protein
MAHASPLSRHVEILRNLLTLVEAVQRITHERQSELAPREFSQFIAFSGRLRKTTSGIDRVYVILSRLERDINRRDRQQAIESFLKLNVSLAQLVLSTTTAATRVENGFRGHDQISFVRETAYAQIDELWSPACNVTETVATKIVPFFLKYPPALVFLALSRALDALHSELASLTLLAIDGQSEQIVRSIEFAPEHKRAGMSVLSYFSEIVNAKYPDLEVRVTIEQNGNVVSLIVDPPDAEREVIEQSLEDYMLVVRGKENPRILFDDELEILRLNQTLEMAKLELRHTQQILSAKTADHDRVLARVENLEARAEEHYKQMVRAFEGSIANSASFSGNLVQVLFELQNQANRGHNKNLELLVSLAKEAHKTGDTIDLITAIGNIAKKDRGLFEELLKKLAVAAAGKVAGAIGAAITTSASLPLPRI